MRISAKIAIIVISLILATDVIPMQLHLFVLIGQSNMMGKAGLPATQRTDARILNFANDWKWKIGIEPIDDPGGQIDQVSKDKLTGYGPSMAFALKMLEYGGPGYRIGLIPCAKNASSMKGWRPSESRRTLYGSCLARIRQAQKMGTVEGILMFQGEREAKTGQDADNWDELFLDMVSNLRNDLDIPNLPVVFAQIGPTPKQISPYWEIVKQRQAAVKAKNVSMITTDDLATFDGLHFDVPSYTIIGERFAAAMWSLLKPGK